MINLREKDRAGICEIAARVFPEGTEIWAYGSRVKGTNHDTSDLDLVVHFPASQEKGEGYNQLADFLEILRESNIPIIVQALAWQGIPENFKSNIQHCYKVLWAA